MREIALQYRRRNYVRIVRADFQPAVAECLEVVRCGNAIGLSTIVFALEGSKSRAGNLAGVTALSNASDCVHESNNHIVLTNSPNNFSKLALANATQCTTVAQPHTPRHVVAMETSAQKTRFALVLLFAINFMNIYDRQIVGAVGERIKVEWMLTDSQLAGLTTAFIMLYAIIGIPLGRLADVASRKHILAVGVTVWSAFTALSGIAGSFGAMIIYRLGVGVGEASASPACNSLIGDLFPPSKRARALGIFMLGVPLGVGASYLISGLVVQLTGSWRTALFIAAAPGLFLGLLALRLPEPPRGGSDAQLLNRAMSARASINMVLRTPTMWWIIASGALYNLNNYALSAFHTSYLIRYHGLDIAVANRFSGAVFGLGGTIGVLAGGWVGDVVGRRAPSVRLQIACAAMVITAPVMWLAMQQPRGEYWAFAMFMFVGLFAMYAYYPIVYATIHDIFEPQIRGMAMSVYFFVFYIFTAIGLFGFGALSDARASVAIGRGATVVDARAFGLHDALLTVPFVSLLVAVALWVASRSADRDQSRLWVG